MRHWQSEQIKEVEDSHIANPIVGLGENPLAQYMSGAYSLQSGSQPLQNAGPSHQNMDLDLGDSEVRLFSIFKPNQN